MFGQARGWDILSRHKADEQVTKELPKEFIPVAPKVAVIDKAYKNATSLVASMERRKQELEAIIRDTEEDLRQTNVVLAGAYQLQHTIEQGIRTVQVHDEIDTTVSQRVTFDDLEAIMRNPPEGANLTSGPSWQDQR